MGAGMQALKLMRILVPEREANYYFLTFCFEEHETEVIHDRHRIEVEVKVEGSVALGEIEEIGRKRAEKFLKDLVRRL